MVGRIDAEEFLEDPKPRVAGHVKREQPRGPDPPMVAEPDEEAGEAEVPDQLVEESRLEGAEGHVTGRPVRGRDLESPGQARRPAEEFLVEVVADSADRLGNEKGGRSGIEEARNVGAAAPKDPEA